MSGAESSMAAPAVDIDALRVRAWLAKTLGTGTALHRISCFAGGQSNPTYRLDTSAGALVLRRKPFGPLLKGAHAIEREARVMEALGATGVPVPAVIGLCEDADVIGAPFYIMELVKGRTLWDPELPDIAREERASYYDATNAAIAALHMIDFEKLGLGDFGQRSNYLERQIRRWTRQYRDDVEAGPDFYMERLIEWLPHHIPAGDPVSIVHGDFRIDNMIWHPSEPRILAILDWELSTLGHPIADFAYHLMTWRIPKLAVPGLAHVNLAFQGIPAEGDYIAAYCRRTGRSAIPELEFHLIFNLFRFAAICHGIKGRVLRGNASSAQADRLAEHLPAYSKLAWTLVCHQDGLHINDIVD